MAIDIDPMADWENTAWAANKPMIVSGVDRSKISKADTGWFNGHTGTPSNITDDSVITNAQVRAYDRFGSLTVAAEAASGTTPTFTVQFDALAAGETLEFDTVVVLGHNFHDLTPIGPRYLFLTVDDGSGTNTTIADTLTLVDNKRLIFTHLYDTGSAKPTYPQRITISGTGAVPKLHIRPANVIYTGSNPKPQLGEVWIGKRSQLMHNPNLPFDDKAEISLTSEFASQSGVTNRYVRHRGKALRTIAKSITDSNELAGVERAFDEADEFTAPFMYIENPAQSAPDGFLMLSDSASLSLPLQGPTERILQMSMTEQPPFKSQES